MWAEAAKWPCKFDEAVLTALDTDGYPVSVRVEPAPTTALWVNCRDAAGCAACRRGSSELAVPLSRRKDVEVKAIQVRGRLEKRDGGWDFVSTSFEAPSKLALLSFLKGIGPLPRNTSTSVGRSPEVNWVTVNEIKRRVSDAKR